jgi:hypothetical protein
LVLGGVGLCPELGVGLYLGEGIGLVLMRSRLMPLKVESKVESIGIDLDFWFIVFVLNSYFEYVFETIGGTNPEGFLDVLELKYEKVITSVRYLISVVLVV